MMPEMVYQNEIKLTIGKDTMEVNGETKPIDTAPFIKDSRTFVPVRFIAEALGAKIEWDEATQQVIIKKIGGDCMETQVFEMAANQGLTAVLFVLLLWHTLKTSGQREERLQAIINNNQTMMQEMVAKLDAIECIKDDVDEIKTSLSTVAATRLT
jgi:Copper amine oxidase N-terminal domain./Protein of unknown function (DUF2762).